MTEARPGPLLKVRNLRMHFPLKRSLSDVFFRRQRQYVRAVDGIDLELRSGESLGLAGESGAGKTVTGEIIAGLQRPTGGQVLVDGNDATRLSGKARLDFRRTVNMVLQDPFDTLNPRWTVARALSEPLVLHGVGSKEERRERIIAVLEKVALKPAHYYVAAYPYQLSGGERQRVAIARALILEPRLLVADEPTTMLDVSIRAGLLNLLRDITASSGLSILFISHDFSTITYLCPEIAIMYRGRIVEQGPSHEVLTKRLHPYTAALAASIPIPDPRIRRKRLPVAVESSAADPVGVGCAFAPRCPQRMPVCDASVPVLHQVAPGHSVACFLHHDAQAS